MTDWHIVHDSRTATPPAIEDGISETTVYERRNVRRETVEDGMGGSITEWVYEQREYTVDEYKMMQLLTMALSNNGVAQIRADIDYVAVMSGVELM